MTAPSGRGPSAGLDRLPETHLALIVEDLVAAVDRGARSWSAAEPDLRAVLLYAWANGARGTGEIARREAVDLGLRYLLRGTQPSAAEIRAFRDTRTANLESFFASVFSLGQRAGLTSLGELRLEPPSGRRGTQPASSQAVWLARHILTNSQAADGRESGDRGMRQETLPAWAMTRASRQEALRAAAGTPRRVPGRPASAPRPGAVIARVMAVFVLLVGGLVAVRWLGAEATPQPVRATAERARAALEPAELSPSAALVEPTPTPEPLDSSEVVAAHDDAMRLGVEALDNDDLVSARSFFLFARGTMPDDEEADTRLRQVEMVLLIGARRDGWTDALPDLADLREFAPGSSVVLQAYVDGLVGAGREALADRSLRRAGDLCGEATRWFPERSDARQCLIQSGFAPTSTRAPAPTPRPTLPPIPPTAPPALDPPTTIPATNPPAPTDLPASPTAAVLVPTAPPPPATNTVPAVSTLIPPIPSIPASAATLLPLFPADTPSSPRLGS